MEFSAHAVNGGDQIHTALPGQQNVTKFVGNVDINSIQYGIYMT